MKFKKYYTDTDQLTQFPALIQASGEPLVDYTITGNTGGVGDATENLIDKNNADLTHNVPNSQTGTMSYNTSYQDKSRTIILPVQPNTKYTVYIGKLSNVFLRVAEYAIYPVLDTTGNILTTSSTGTTTNYNYAQFTTGATAQYIAWYFSWEATTEQLAAKLATMMLIADDDIINDYIPYGYKIPVNSGGETKTLYIDSPLGLTDTLTYTQTGIAIPTFDGDNTITFGTTVQPSVMSAEYKGWHSQDNVRVYNGSQWE